MIKSISLIRRKPGVTHEEFLDYWEMKHAPLVTRVVPGLRKYVQNHVVMSTDLKDEIDGIAETWFDSLEEYQRRWNEWQQSEAAKVLRVDENKFIDLSKFARYIVEEHIIK